MSRNSKLQGNVRRCGTRNVAFTPLQRPRVSTTNAQIAERPGRCNAGFLSEVMLAVLCVALSGCMNPIGADKTTPAVAYRQIHDNPVSHSQPSRETRWVLHRFEQIERFENSPDDTLQLILKKAV